MTRPRITVVGIGADGFEGLVPGARRVLAAAAAIHGGPRQLALLPAEVAAQRRPWPTPLLPALGALPADAVVLASGDPMLYGIGATLARCRPDAELRVLPHVSSVTLACARLGWPVQEVSVVSAVARDPAPAVRALRSGSRVLVLSESGTTPALLAARLSAAGVRAELTVLEQLGGPAERIRPWAQGQPFDDLNVIAAVPASGSESAGSGPAEFVHDGQITKPDVRALTVGALRPGPGLLWDVGAGSGSVGLTWAATGGGKVIAIERRADRADRVARNALRHGVRARVLTADSAALPANLPTPDAVFIGGGLTAALAEYCLTALRPGGSLVANAVTTESQTLILQLHRRFGGTVTMVTVADLRPLGPGTSFEPRRPVVQWAITKEER